MDEPAATLVRAARRAFARYGVDRATMTDVAREAGVVRQTVYNTVPGRDALVELAMVQVCEELQEQIDAVDLASYGDVGDALVEFLARSVEITGGDEELAALAGGLSPERVQAVFGDSHPLEELIRQSLHPVLERAASEGRLRDGVSVDAASRWLQGVLTFALLHDATDADSLRRDVRTFALPSVLTV